MARRSVLGEEEPADINLSPMIDCIFILLIFFIVTTVFVDEKGLQVEKPDAAASTVPNEDQDNLVFEITAQDKVLFQGHEIAYADVMNKVKARRGSDIPVSIRASAKSEHGVFVSVWDAAKRGGATALSFTTVN